MDDFHAFPHIFQPLKVGPLTLKNRIQFAPMVSAHADAETGRVTQDLIDYIGGQARTGAALITMKKGAIRSMPEPSEIEALQG